MKNRYNEGMNWNITLRAGILALIAAVVIFFQHASLPADLTGDEIEFARFAVKLTTQGYAPYDSYATGHATLYFYILLASFKLFGLSQFALRLPSAVFGVLGVVALYSLFRQVFKDVSESIKCPLVKHPLKVDLAFIVTGVFALTRWYYSFARYSFEATFIIFLELVSLSAIVKFINTRRIPWLVLSAFFAGLAYNSYQPGRLFIFIPVLAFALFSKVRTLKNLLIYACICGAVMLPLTVYLGQQNDVRIQQQLYFADKNLTVAEKGFFLLDNIDKTIRMFFWQGDVSGRHNYPHKPALTLIAAAFALIGLIVAVRNFRHPYNAIFLVYAILAIIPTLLTYPHENPNMLRTITVIPAVMYFLGLGIMTLAHFSMHNKYLKKHYSYCAIGILLLLGLSAYHDARTYFVFQRKVFTEAFEIKDGFAGVYVFMHDRNIPVEGFTLAPHERALYEKLGRER